MNALPNQEEGSLGYGWKRIEGKSYHFHKMEISPLGVVGFWVHINKFNEIDLLKKVKINNKPTRAIKRSWLIKKIEKDNTLIKKIKECQDYYG